MSDELLENYISQLIASHRSDKVAVAWQGGEPTLMGIDFYRRAITLQEKYRRPGMTFENTMQTNGTRLNDEWCEFFHENDFLIGISIDGPGELHNAHRVDKSGRPTFDRVMGGLRLLQKHGVEYNVLVTVNRINADHPLEVYRFLRDEVKTSWIQFIPAIERLKDGRNWLGPGSSGMCVFDPICGHGLALEHNGDLYACDHFVEPGYLLGNILQKQMIDLVGSGQQRKFGRDKLDTLPSFCRECDVRFACHGECPKNRFLNTPDGEPGLNYLCAGYKSFFNHADRSLKILAGLIQRGLPAMKIMDLLAQEEAQQAEVLNKIGRNAPCPCGSGLKFKKCHGREGISRYSKAGPKPGRRSQSRP
jgi:uncharacterized protein